MSEHRPYTVLFLCTGNSARSILAEAVLRRLGADRFRSHSAGSDPKGCVHPFALDLLRSASYPLEGLRSKSWDEFAMPGAPAIDFIFTLCDGAAGEACPAWLGRPTTAHWGMPDPAAIEGSEAVRRAAFAETLRMLNRRIGIFVQLPFASLDAMSLRSRVAAIGEDTGGG